MKELEEMKKQLSLLQSKLDNQKIVSDRLLRNSMHQRTTWVKRYVYFQLFVLLPFIYVVYAYLVAELNLSWWLYAYTVIMCTLCVAADVWINNYYLCGSDFQKATPLELAHKIVRQKQLRWYGFAGGMAMLLPWIIWFGFEISKNLYGPALLIPLCVGVLIGGIIGFSILLRMQRTNDQLMYDIRDLKSESDNDSSEKTTEI